MNVFNAGVVHAAATPGLWIQGGFKHGAENRRADLRPVKVRRGAAEQQIAQLLRKGRDDDRLVGKQASVDIGKGGQQRVVISQIGIALITLLIEHPKELCQSFAHVFHGKLRHVVMKHQVLAKDARVLGIQAEHQAHTELVQVFQRLRVLGIMVLLQQPVIQQAKSIFILI